MNEILNEIFKSGIAIPEAPVWINKEKIASRLGEHSYCEKNCSDQPCKDYSDPEKTCLNGLDTYSYKIDDTTITVYGILNNREIKDKRIKHISKGRNYKKSISNEWINKITELTKKIKIIKEKSESNILHYFHDPVKWANQIHICAEKIIKKTNGENFSEQIENSTSEIKSLYKAANMLVNSFNLTGIYFNPQSAGFGDRKPCEVYKLFDKVQAIIFHAEGSKYNKRFRLTGKSIKKITTFESFQIIPLCLIQNAVKYSKENEIEIHINDTAPGIEVHITSTGYEIPKEEIEKIFLKGQRGKHASKLHHDGHGIGLYVAQEIAKIHGFKINVSSTPQHYERDGIPIAENKFYFTIPS